MRVVHALSSEEAEYYAALKGACAALGFQSMLRDLGLKASVKLLTDSSAARGIIHREGLGKLRRLETGYLWLQAAREADMGSCKEVITPGVKEVSSSSEPAWFEEQVKKKKNDEGP